MSEYAVHKRVKSQIPDSGSSICIVLEYPTTTESRLNKINTGGIQQVLNPMCKFAGIDAQTVMLTHAIQLKPAQENPQNFFHKRSEYKKLKKETEWRSQFAPTQYGYLKEEYEQDIKRLKDEINKCNPTIIIAMGNISLWSLYGLDKVGSYRGSFLEADSEWATRPYKIMPTYSPLSIIKNYSFRPTVAADLKKAVSAKDNIEIEHTEREILIEPTVQEVNDFLTECELLNTADSPLSFDIETAFGEITCIGFAPNEKRAMVIPFKTEDGKEYWNYYDELIVWNTIKQILSNPNVTKVAQNQTYDISWLRHKYKIEVKGTVHDTMHAQHSLQPEMEKSLGYLGSIYTNEGAWKNLTSFSKSTKAEE
jgi:uracil-DNA glycosylase